MIRVTSNLPVLYAKGVDQSPLKNCGHCIRHVFLALLVAFWTLPIQFVVLSRQLLWQVDDSWTFGLQETCAETLLVLPQIFSVGLLVATKTTTGVTMSACHETKKTNHIQKVSRGRCDTNIQHSMCVIFYLRWCRNPQRRAMLFLCRFCFQHFHKVVLSGCNVLLTQGIKLCWQQSVRMKAWARCLSFFARFATSMQLWRWRQTMLLTVTKLAKM